MAHPTYPNEVQEGERHDEAVRKAREMLDKLPGIKEDELAKLGPCVVCGKELLSTDRPNITFYRLRLERAGFDGLALRRRVGLGMAIGSDALARVMGPDEPLARVISGPHDVVVHESCSMNVYYLLNLFPNEPDKEFVGSDTVEPEGAT